MFRQEQSLPVVLVTGAGRKGRVGEAIALDFHAKKYNVVVHCHHSQEDAGALCKELNALRPNSAVAVKGNLGGDDIDELVNRLIDSAVKYWGRLDVLINSASLFQVSVPGLMNYKQAQNLMQINAIAPMLLTQAFANYLDRVSRDRRGCVINISDIFARQPSECHAAYNASKIALEKFTIDTAASFKNIRVVALQPGAMLLPDGTSLLDPGVMTYEGTSYLREKIFEVIANPDCNGSIISCAHAADKYPEHYFEGNELK